MALDNVRPIRNVSTHSRAEAAAIDNHAERANVWFQHTAARRRLLAMVCGTLWAFYVSTHSRAEAAAVQLKNNHALPVSFNTQPRGGGCACK